MTLADGEAPLEAYPEAAAILRDAGWTPHPEWGVFTRATLVMGGTPDALSFHVKDFARIPEGHPSYSADTPDTAGEAAEWLKRRFTPAPVEENPLSLASLETHREETPIPLAPVSEEGENLQDESNGETGEEIAPQSGEDEFSDGVLASVPEGGASGADGANASGNAGGWLVGSGVAGEEWTDEAGGNGSGGAESDSVAIDADFTIEDLGGPDETLELPAPDPEDFAPEEFPPEEDPAPGVAIFGPPADHLEALRSQRMGDTMRYANMLMPPWTPDDNARLAYLRNFAMGVSEGRWENNSTMQSELESCESTLSRVNDIKEARDTKVAFLEGADRAGVEGFVVEADWP